MRKIQLEITGPDGLVQVEALSQQVAILGSGPAATVRLADPSVSATHFLLKFGGDGDLTLLDLGSESGTRLRGRRVNQPMVLTSGDVVEVGDTRVLVHFDEPDAETTEELPVLSRSGTPEVEATVRDRALVPARARDTGNPPTGATESSRCLEASLYWGDALLEVRTFRPGQAVRIGPGPDSDFALEGAGLGSTVELVSVTGAIQPPPKAALRVRHEGAETIVPRIVRLGVGETSLVDFGRRSLRLRWIQPSAKIRSAPFDGVDFAFARILSIGALVHLMVFLGFLITPTVNEFPPEGLFANPSEMAKYIVRPVLKTAAKFPTLPEGKTGDKPRGPTGRLGSRNSRQAEADPSKRGTPRVDPRHREADRKRVLSTGLLAAFGENESAAADVLGPGGLGNGINQALGGLKPGGGIGTMGGIGGLGSRGTAPGGDGHAIGLGGLGTHGPGRGGGGPELGIGGPSKDPVHIIQDKRSVGVALDKSVIAKVIRRHWNEIKYCYETQLNQNPHLAGKVAVAFTIDGTGAVADANVSESSMGNTKVEDCMVTDIKRWRFPEPRGGGEVFVSYPWVFKAAGEEE